MSLIGLIVALIILGLLLYLVQLLPIDPTFKVIIRILVILVVILWLCSTFGLFVSGPYHHPWFR